MASVALVNHFQWGRGVVKNIFTVWKYKKGKIAAMIGHYFQNTIPVYFVCLNGSPLTTFHISAHLVGKCGFIGSVGVSYPMFYS
jgi:hypothetical protein